MNLGEAKEKVYKLLDEHSSGGEIAHDADIEMKMADFFDIAQKKCAQVERLTGVMTLRRKAGRTEFPMPDGFDGLVAVWRDGETTNRYRWKNGKLVVPESDTAEIQVEYFKTPETINGDTADDEEFEVSEFAAQLLPFYVCAQNLFPDLMIDYRPYLLEWEKGLQELERRQAERGGGIRFVNTFYRRG